jgi:hypothetical protein
VGCGASETEGGVEGDMREAYCDHNGTVCGRGEGDGEACVYGRGADWVSVVD